MASLSKFKVSGTVYDLKDSTARAALVDATTSTKGLMTTAMVTKLNGIDTDANKYVHPSYTSRTSNMYKITVDDTGHISDATAVTKSDITALGIPSKDTTYSDFSGATSSAAGTAGLVPAPAAGNTGKYLKGDGTWAEVAAVAGSVDETNEKLVLNLA